MINKPIIAVDAMGGDYAPQETVRGALLAARSGVSILLFGDELKLATLLSAMDPEWHTLPLSIVATSEIIDMAEDPAKSVMQKSDSSLVRAMKAVRDGQALAVVSAGNSGAALVASVVFLGKLPGIHRPAIGGFIPTKLGSTFCIDLGGNIDCKPEYLYQFALMGEAYVAVVKGLPVSKVGILANGTEVGKGTKLIQDVYKLLAQSGIAFVGNCEPYDILHGAADVVVCDGFSGNIMLKSMEATLQVVTQWLRDEGSKTFFSRIAAYLSKPFLSRIKKQVVKGQEGGALLLGVTKPCVIAHGSAKAETIKDAICFAYQVALEKKYDAFIEILEKKRVHYEQIAAQALLQDVVSHI